jgi:SAM-dependent methyltransferase
MVSFPSPVMRREPPARRHRSSFRLAAQLRCVLASPSMSDYDFESYGATFASVYDSWYEERMNPEMTVSFLASMASGGLVLELGIGTGRVALALADRGIMVTGVEGSAAMIGMLREKPRGPDLSITIGNFADVPVAGRFSLIYMCFSTIFLLPNQAEQIRCLRNIARHLAPDGCFVLDAFVPDTTRYVNQQCVSLEDISDARVRIDVAHHDPVEQRISSSRVVFGGNEVKVYPYALRYAYPPELDVMGMLAGLRLRARYGGYDRSPFQAGSTSHVSVYALDHVQEEDAPE